MTLDELRRLAFAVEPISLQEPAADVERDVTAFNSSVARFRELVVRARNGLVQGQKIHPVLAFEIRTLAEALPSERVRTGRRRLPGRRRPA